jgi:isoamylase
MRVDGKCKAGTMTAPMQNTPGRIFISYRREETAFAAGWLFDVLAEHFDREQIFKDIDSIQLGDNWFKAITDAVRSCDVLLALIGERWLTVTDDAGRRRLDSQEDWVRVEIETALERNISVIPIVVERAKLPRADQLPPTLAGLVQRQVLEISPRRFRSDSVRLTDQLHKILNEMQAASLPTPSPASSPARGQETARIPKTHELPKNFSHSSEMAVGKWKLLPRDSSRLGAIYDGKGTDFSIFSRVAERVELCLVDDEGREERIDLPERDVSVWGVYIENVHPGQLYGYRIHGLFAPDKGLRCNPSKFLIDPYARAIHGEVEWGQEVFSHKLDEEKLMNADDSRSSMPKSVVVDSDFDWTGDVRLNTPLSDSIIYEAHVKGLTIQRPEIPEPIRGTYAGLAHPTMIEHYQTLGVTAIQLMPIHQFVQDGLLLERGLSNYWGYNTVGFFAPHGPYSSTGTRGQQVAEFKKMTKDLHLAGIEVILDVVFNHTAEGNHNGPTLSFRGIDNAAYYRLQSANPFYYTDFTGTGNSMNTRDSQALQLIMDSLRYWVEEMHIDGFRFDLCSALAREDPRFPRGDTFFSVVQENSELRSELEREIPHFSREAALFSLIQQDPALKKVKLIAEPWDASPFGYQVGNFPAGWSELNGAFRDDIRDFWRGKGKRKVLTDRLSGSPDVYKLTRRRPNASVNFVTSHDGFTLVDLVSYKDKRNEANKENNHDGTDDNRSWNCGFEGPTDDPEIQAIRLRQRKNLLTSLILAQGVPLLLAGDELGRTQQGNNNAYCQDNYLSWIRWQGLSADQDLTEFVGKLTRLRRDHPIFRRRRYSEGRPVRGSGHIPDLALVSRLGNIIQSTAPIGEDEPFGIFLNGRVIHDANGRPITDNSFILYLNGNHRNQEVSLPGSAYAGSWEVVIDTVDELTTESEVTYTYESKLSMLGNSALVLRSLS